MEIESNSVRLCHSLAGPDKDAQPSRRSAQRLGLTCTAMDCCKKFQVSCGDYKDDIVFQRRQKRSDRFSPPERSNSVLLLPRCRLEFSRAGYSEVAPGTKITSRQAADPSRKAVANSSMYERGQIQYQY
ncbi:Hypothetical_protein [Hexamita inflata]|uniref:Hypothetical_protein n=1 Tax=Hexamita inflata TaxID=28002 RepID=A0AA86P5N1_9EUKA|nr:Hypothetical protein HINF_LOCUS18534 [Hexamita inflata]CAI9940857.1 Hypothetical protein HINF_LOCUS28502 [Hexamita inflata]